MYSIPLVNDELSVISIKTEVFTKKKTVKINKEVTKSKVNLLFIVNKYSKSDVFLYICQMNPKLEKIIFDYLNDKNYHILPGNSDIVFGKRLNEDYITDLYFVENISDEKSIIRILMGDENICYIYGKLVVEIKDFFSLDADESKYIIWKWVNDIVNIGSHDVFYGTHDFLVIPNNSVVSVPIKIPIERPIQVIDSMTMKIIKTKIDF